MLRAASQLVPPSASKLETVPLSAEASVLHSNESFTLEEKLTRETSTASGVPVLLANSLSMSLFVAALATARRLVRVSLRL